MFDGLIWSYRLSDTRIRSQKIVFVGELKDTFIFQRVLKILLPCSFDGIFRLFRPVFVDLGGTKYHKIIKKSAKSYKSIFL